MIFVLKLAVGFAHRFEFLIAHISVDKIRHKIVLSSSEESLKCLV